MPNRIKVSKLTYSGKKVWKLKLPIIMEISFPWRMVLLLIMSSADLIMPNKSNYYGNIKLCYYTACNILVVQKSHPVTSFFYIEVEK